MSVTGLQGGGRGRLNLTPIIPQGGEERRHFRKYLNKSFLCWMLMPFIFFCYQYFLHIKIYASYQLKHIFHNSRIYLWIIKVFPALNIWGKGQCSPISACPNEDTYIMHRVCKMHRETTHCRTEEQSSKKKTFAYKPYLAYKRWMSP